MLLLNSRNRSFALTVGMCMGSLFLYFFSFLIISCNKKSVEPNEYSEAFKPVFANTTHYFELGQPARGMYYLDSSFIHIKKPNLNDRFRYFGFHYIYQKATKGNYKLALTFADSMLSMARQSVSKQQYVSNFAEANYAKGDAYFNLNQYNDSYQCYFQGYLIAKNYLNKRSLSDYTYRMGMIMYKQAHYKQAVQYFKDSYTQDLSASDNGKDDFAAFYRRQELLDNIAISYKHCSKIDSAVFYFDKTLAYINDNNGRFKNRANMMEMARAVVYGNKAEALIIDQQYDKAKGLLRKSIAINLKKGGDNLDAQLAEIKLAQIYYNQRKSDSLYKQLISLRKQLDILRNPDAETDWNRLMGAYYLRKKDAVKALTYLQSYNLLKDSAIKRLSTLKESDVNQQLANFE